MCDKYDRQLRYWKRYWSRYNIPKYMIYGLRNIRREYGESLWFKEVIIPCIHKIWNTNGMIWHDVCHMCDMKGLMNYGYDIGM